jgi:diguanylate cyclase
MPEAELPDAFRVVDRLRGQIAQSAPVGQGGRRYTFSAGLVRFGYGETSDQVYKRVDQALYRAKQNGRNRVEQSA